MLWVLKRILSMRQFFWAPKTYALKYGQENIYNFTLKIFVYLNLWSHSNFLKNLTITVVIIAAALIRVLTQWENNSKYSAINNLGNAQWLKT